MTIDTAFLVCAGLGTRMQPLTDSCPKPLLPLGGKPLLSYILDHLQATDVSRVVANSHHLAPQMSAFLAGVTGFEVAESHEPVLLETGGGLVKALPLLGNAPFFMINGDAFWIDGPSGSVLQQMAQQFDAERMDILLCLIPVSRMALTEGVGDYDVLPDGRLKRNLAKQGTHMFTGIRILNPRIMAGYSADKFSFLKNMDEAERNGRLYGLVMDGDWHHISTPEDLTRVEASL